jgi:hypothetical protein
MAATGSAGRCSEPLHHQTTMGKRCQGLQEIAIKQILSSKNSKTTFWAEHKFGLRFDNSMATLGSEVEGVGFWP